MLDTCQSSVRFNGSTCCPCIQELFQPQQFQVSIFFHLNPSETQSFILKLHLSTYKLQPFRFPTFSRYIFFWLPDQGRLRISRYCGNHLRLMFINPTPHFSCQKSKGINLPHHPHSSQVMLPSATPRDVLNHHHPAGCLLKDWGVRTSTHHRFGRHSKTIGSTFCQIPQQPELLGAANVGVRNVHFPFLMDCRK